MNTYATIAHFNSDGSVQLSDETTLECEIDHEGTFLRCGEIKVYLCLGQMLQRSAPTP